MGFQSSVSAVASLLSRQERWRTRMPWLWVGP